MNELERCIVSEPEAEREHAVIDGVIQYTSVSALQKADRCPRAWWYKYVKRLDEPMKGNGIKRGKEGHQRLEHYQRTGQDILDPLERLGVLRGYVPAPGTGQVEVAIDGKVTAGPIRMKGSIDLYVPGEKSIVRDWKFKKDIGKWGCSSEDLISEDHEAGIQMLGYAEFARLQGAKLVEVSHVTFQTKGRPDVSIVKATIDAELIAGKWQAVVDRIVPEVIHAAAQTDKDKVRPNYNACEKYGGCAFRAECQNRMQRLAGGFAAHLHKRGENNVGIFNRVAPPAAPAPVQTPATQPAPASVTQPVAAPVTQPAVHSAVFQPAPKPSKMAVPTQLTASGAARGARYALPNGLEGTFVAALTGETGVHYNFATNQGAVLLEANDPITSIGPAAPVVASERQPSKPSNFAGGPGVPQILPPDAPMSAPVPSPVATAPAAAAQGPSPETLAETPKKRGRPAGSKNLPKSEAVTIAAAAPEVEDLKLSATGHQTIVADAKELADFMAAPIPGGLHLYYGCSPVGVVTQTLHSWVDQLETDVIKVANENGLSTLKPGDDIRTADDKALGFGKWVGYLAAAAKVSQPPPGHYVVDRGADQRVDVAADALSPFAFVVRGGGR